MPGFLERLRQQVAQGVIFVPTPEPARPLPPHEPNYFDARENFGRSNIPKLVDELSSITRIHFRVDEKSGNSDQSGKNFQVPPQSYATRYSWTIEHQNQPPFFYRGRKSELGYDRIASFVVEFTPIGQVIGHSIGVYRAELGNVDQEEDLLEACFTTRRERWETVTRGYEPRDWGPGGQ